MQKLAESIAIDQDDVAPKPASLCLHEAAAVPLVSLAAWQALVDRAHVKPGQKGLVHAGSGGLGSTVIQLAKHLGATSCWTRSGARTSRGPSRSSSGADRRSASPARRTPGSRSSSGRRSSWAS
jgi:NADPH:quinone reductase-like Zn-dependent oxidoreductase